MKYSEAIRQAIIDSMSKDKNMKILGQGVWSPFYVGKTMDKVNVEFGNKRVIDTPVSENAVTAIAFGSALTGSSTLVIHPRMDFMILAMDAIVNAAAKWRYVLNWKGKIPFTIRTIINRGGEQGAQHSQSLQSWFCHIPGLKVVMPSNPEDAYYLLRSCIESPDPCIYIEDRWSYDDEKHFDTSKTVPELSEISPKILKYGDHVTLVSYGFPISLCLEAAQELLNQNISVEVIDLRIITPMNLSAVNKSIIKTGRLIVVDASWESCSVASEIISQVSKTVFSNLRRAPIAVHLPSNPAPTSSALEKIFYFSKKEIMDAIRTISG